jgi:hypothetical protein
LHSIAANDRIYWAKLKPRSSLAEYSYMQVFVY